MAQILNIDTSTEICSVALAKNKEILAYREISDPRGHASNLAVFINEVMEEADTNISAIDAVAVSKGPGSYTGLRIGVSTAKGLCFGSDIPLISVRTLQQMAAVAFHSPEYQHDGLLCSMIDARRMEVYTRIFDQDLQPMNETTAVVLDENSFAAHLNSGNVYFYGNGAEKAKPLLQHPNAHFIDHIQASAKGMIPFSLEKFQQQDFENTAYFEPFYLKEFIATTSKKDILKPN